MYRILSDSAVSGVPTVVIPGVVAAAGSNPVSALTSAAESAKPLPIDTGNSDSEMLMLIQKDKERNQTTSTTSTTSTTLKTTTLAATTTTTLPPTTTTTTTKRPIPDFDLETPWDVLRPPKAKNQSSTSTTTPKPLPLPFDYDPKPHPILNIKFPDRIQSTSTTTTTTTTALPEITSSKPSTKFPVNYVFDLETSWDALKNYSLPSTESPTTITTEAPTSWTAIPTTSHNKPLSTQEVVILKFNHRNQSIATYQPTVPQSSTTPDVVIPLSSTPAPLPFDNDYDTPTIISNPDTYLTETDAEDEDLDSVIIYNPEAANFPVDEVFDDTLSYITTLLDNPLLQKSLPKKPIRKQIIPPNRVVFKGFNEFPTLL